jgi:hypothetical protein
MGKATGSQWVMIHRLSSVGLSITLIIVGITGAWEDLHRGNSMALPQMGMVDGLQLAILLWREGMVMSGIPLTMERIGLPVKLVQKMLFEKSQQMARGFGLQRGIMEVLDILQMAALPGILESTLPLHFRK